MKVVIVRNEDFSTWHFSRGLISTLIQRGIEVTVVTPDGPYVPKLVGLGAKHVVVSFYRFTSPLRDLKLCFQLYRVFRTEKPDVVHNMSVKPNVYGALAAWLAGVPKIVSLVCGAGYAFSETRGWKQRVLRFLVSRLYWLAGKVTHRTWFLNNDDLSLFVECSFTTPEKAVLISSEGINLKDYSPNNVSPDALSSLREEFGVDDSTIVVLLMLQRITWSKGVKEFVEASERSTKWRTAVKFIMVGGLDPDSPDPVPEEYLRPTQQFAWVGFRSDVAEVLALADIVTLPSFYREGVPRNLLEALAMKKPIVTTDNVGCRDVVDHGKNGFLVRVRDTDAFAVAVEKLVSDSELRASFGRHSLAKARREFDEEIVNRRVLTELYGLDGGEHSK